MSGLSLVFDSIPQRRADAEPATGAARALVEWLSDGAVSPARLGREDALTLLGELGCALADLAACVRPREAVRVGVASDPWELGFERVGADVLVTAFRGGALPEVTTFERRLDGESVRARMLAAIDECAEDGDPRLALARSRLTAPSPFVRDADGSAEPSLVQVEPTGEAPVVIAADVLLRGPVAEGPVDATVQRADLFSLLFRGRLRFTVGEHTRELADVAVFLVAEQLVGTALEMADAWTRTRPYYRRLLVGGAILGVRLASTGTASLTFGSVRRPHEHRAQTRTHPSVDALAWMQGVALFGRALSRSLLRRDRSQASNLRLADFRVHVRELASRLREATLAAPKINEAPESYRAFAASQSVAPAPSSDNVGRGRLRFVPKWIAAVPMIDLRSTFLCGDRFVVGAAREVSCLDTRTGMVLWRRRMSRAVSVITPVGLARLESDGGLSIFDLETGDVRWSMHLAARVGATASGAVVSAPGLPRMLIVSEGSRHLTAVDLHAGDVRWRYTAQRSAPFRLRRAGRLLLVTCGDATLTALDLLSGQVVWRFCDRLRFSSRVAVDHDAVFAIAGEGALVGAAARLHQLDPWSGAARWSVDLPAQATPVGAPMLSAETVAIVTHGRHGTGLLGIDRKTGERRFEQTVCTTAASCLMVDETIVVNSEGGELCAVHAADGSPRYRHVFSNNEGDPPRRLEPVLRSGALFVPQSEVHVLRPHDGTVLGRIPSDLIPDLLRVDERCDAYVAEESGHLAAYSAGPRLSLVPC